MALESDIERELVGAFGAYPGVRRDKEEALRLLRNTKPAQIIQIRRRHERTLLHYAAINDWSDVCRQLVEIYQMDPQRTMDCYFRTALHDACSRNSIDVVKYLVIHAHCDPFAGRDMRRGNTPFDDSHGESRAFLQDIIDQRNHFLEAMAECEEEITQLNVILHGPPGVGKTSLSRVILGEKPLPKEERNSTKIMENPVRAIKANQLNEFEGHFEKISEEKLIHLIAEFLKKRMKPQDKTQLQDAYEIQSLDETQVRDKIQPQDETQPRDEIQLANRQRNQSTTSQDNQQPVPIPADSTSTVIALKNINNALSSAQPSSRMFRSKWLNLIDSGGQPQFQDMLPLLFRSPSLQIVLMRLTERLEDKPKMCYTVGGENVVCAPDDLHLTNLQYIERACQIAADANPPSKVMIIGTHKDKLKGDVTAELDTLEKDLGDLPKTYKHVILPTSTGKTIFPMNTMAIGKERKEYSKEMQDAITAVTNTSLTEPQSIPLRWFVFQLALRNKASVIKMKDCITLGHLLGMKEDVVKKALIFFNQSALLLYYPDADPDLVLTKVDPIIERLSQIVTTTFQVPPQLRAFHDLCARLGEKGLFDAAFCDKLFKTADFSDGLTDQEFLKLLVSLRLAVLVNEKEQLYFLPSALSYRSPSTESAVSLACGFILEDYKKDERILPHSFYFTSVIELLSNKNHQFELLDSDGSKKQYRNQIQVYDKSRNIPGAVILSDKTWWIQVSVPIPDCCFSTSKAVKEAIHLAKERLQHTAVALITKVFPCPIAGHSDHYCTVTINNKYYTCSKSCQCGPVIEDMKHWMEGSSLDCSNQLTTQNMFNLLQDKSSRWSDIGRAFGVSDNDRESLRRDPALTDNDRLEKVLCKWLESTAHPTWAQFHKILTYSLNFNNIGNPDNPSSTSPNMTDDHIKTIDTFEVHVSDRNKQSESSTGTSITTVADKSTTTEAKKQSQTSRRPEIEHKAEEVQNERSQRGCNLF